jgi:hypothetical protein
MINKIAKQVSKWLGVQPEEKQIVPTVCFFDSTNLDSVATAWIVKELYPTCNLYVTNLATVEPSIIHDKAVVLCNIPVTMPSLKRLQKLATHTTLLTNYHVPSDILEINSPNFVLKKSDKDSAAIVAWNHFDTSRIPYPAALAYINAVVIGSNIFNDASILVANLAVGNKWSLSKITELNEALENNEKRANAKHIGQILQDHTAHVVDSIITGSVYINFGEYKHVPLAIAPAIYSFDVARYMAKGEQLAISCRLEGRMLVVNLYSEQWGVDVGAIAQKYGGYGTDVYATFSTEVLNEHFAVQEATKIFDNLINGRFSLLDTISTVLGAKIEEA